jgi:hypothetical protein
MELLSEFYFLVIHPNSWNIILHINGSKYGNKKTDEWVAYS